MNNNQRPNRSVPTPCGYPRAARLSQWSIPVWPGKRGLVACAALCLILLIAPSACGSSHAPSTAPKSKVVFDETVSANLVSPDFTLTGYHQTMAWTCDPGAQNQIGLMLIFIGAAGTDPATAQQLYSIKGSCNSGSVALQIPPGSYFLKFAPAGTWHIVLTDVDYSPSVATEIASGHFPTTTPNPAPDSVPSVGYQTAWGSQAVSGTYSMKLDSTHTFIAGGVSPDGTMLLGGEEIASSNAGAPTYQAGYYTLATRRFTPIGVSDGETPVFCSMSDGRFLIAEDSDTPGPGYPGIEMHERYWAYDLQTGQLHLVVSAERYGGFAGSWLSHGLLIVQTYVGFLVANLAAGTLAPLTPSATATGGLVQEDDFVWPYLLYEATPTPSNGAPPPSAIHVYNLLTHQDTHLSSVERLRNSFPGGESVGFTIAGDSLLASVVTQPTHDSLGNLLTDGSTTLYLLPHVLSGGTQQQSLATFKGSAEDFIAGDTLYVTVNVGTTFHDGVLANPGVTTLYALAHILSGGSQPQLILTVPSDIESIASANARMIAFYGGEEDPTTGQGDTFGAVWDLTLHTLVTFPSRAGNEDGFSISLTGTDLAVEEGPEGDEAVLIFDTTKLPTTSTGG